MAAVEAIEFNCLIYVMLFPKVKNNMAISRNLLACLVGLVLSTSVFAQLTSSSLASTRHIGNFSGPVGKDATITLNCQAENVCEYRISNNSKPSEELLAAKTNRARFLDVIIPNNNLHRIKDAVTKNPDKYNGLRDGEFLQPLRPLLESKVSFDSCFGEFEGDGGGEWGLVCFPASSDGALPDAVMLMTTMNQTCDHQAFCAYLMFPLRRVAP